MLRTLTALSALTLLAVSPLAAQEASEEIVTIPFDGLSLAGTLTLPEGGSDAEPAPVVILFHGFNVSRNAPLVAGTEESLLGRSARLLAEKGYASLRVDFPGAGDSEGEFANISFEGEVAAGRAILGWAQADARVDGQDVFLAGWSQGGLVATAVAGRTGAPDAVALWAAVEDPMESFEAAFGAETIAAGLETGDTPLRFTLIGEDLPLESQIELRQPFFEGLVTFDPSAEIAAYEGPVLFAQGSLDTLVLPGSAVRLMAAHEGPDEMHADAMDHFFDVFERTEALDAMVAATARFFDDHAD